MRNIYSNAEEVAVWLGDEEFRLDVFRLRGTIDFIRGFRTKLLLPGYFEDGQGLNKDFHDIDFLAKINDITVSLRTVGCHVSGSSRK